MSITPTVVRMNVVRDLEFDNEEYAFGTPCYPNLPTRGSDCEYRLVITKRESSGEVYYNVATKLSEGDLFPSPVPDFMAMGVGTDEPLGGAFYLGETGSSVFRTYDEAVEVYNKIVKRMTNDINETFFGLNNLPTRQMMCKECFEVYDWTLADDGRRDPYAPGIGALETKVKPWAPFDECLCLTHIYK